MRREGTWQGGGEFLGDTGSWGTLPPFSSALCGTQGSARRGRRRGEERGRRGVRRGGGGEGGGGEEGREEVGRRGQDYT